MFTVLVMLLVIVWAIIKICKELDIKGLMKEKTKRKLESGTEE